MCWLTDAFVLFANVGKLPSRSHELFDRKIAQQRFFSRAIDIKDLWVALAARFPSA
jgi:hypothetical protein